MNHPKYPFEANDGLFTYEFYSIGPRGRIKKMVIYSQVAENLFNLSFGDWNNEAKGLDDFNRSNNGDRDKVLATVASTALDFTDHFPKASIFVEGSTPSRTRLYQMSICQNLFRINEKFKVKGFNNDQWEVFQGGTNYEAFLITKK